MNLLQDILEHVKKMAESLAKWTKANPKNAESFAK